MRTDVIRHANPCKDGKKCNMCKADKKDGATYNFRLCPYCTVYTLHTDSKPAVYCSNKRCREPLNEKAGGHDVIFVCAQDADK